MMVNIYRRTTIIRGVSGYNTRNVSIKQLKAYVKKPSAN